MAEKEEISGGFPWLPLVTLLTVGSGVILLLPQITSSRPGGGDPKLVQTFDPQAINARLWQDPLGVVIADQGTNVATELKLPNEHSIDHFQDLLIEKCFPKPPFFPLTRERLITENAERGRESTERLQICAVMIPGGPYVEDVERRIRARRAVIEALGEAHYRPEQDHELGYVCLPWQPLVQNVTAAVSRLERNRANYQDSTLLNIPAIKAARRGLLYPENVTLLLPYEWFEMEEGSAGTKAQSHLLVFWLNDDALVDAPIARLADLISWLRLDFVTSDKRTALPLSRFVVLGPDNSGTLRNMVLEAKDNSWNEETRQFLGTTHVYSSQAAAADKQLLKGIDSVLQRSGEFITKAVKGDRTDNAFIVERTLPLDDKIVDALWAEIDKRGLTQNDHVAIISELDTFYARALSRSFRETPRNHSSAYIVDSYSYIRGIDGKLPSDEKKQENSASSEKSDKKAPASSRPTEETEGLNQADDIRRLAQELQKANDSRTGGKLKAVGLLGSDVYDKLELLKALRPALPEAVFFTNNLDARLVHPDEWSETHNLIVASPYRLYLEDHDKVPPFRDSGQTSLFAATLEALGEKPNLPKAPSIFEVDRDGLKELKSSNDARKTTISAFIRVGWCIATAALLCAWIWFVSRVAKKTKNDAQIPGLEESHANAALFT
jgi:hypothetical protein